MSYFRVILRIPIGLDFEALSAMQQEAIRSVFGQFVMPMPGTQNTLLWKLADAVTLDNFKPEQMGLYGLTWPIVGMWDESGTALRPFDEAAFREHLPAGSDLIEPHRWAGWPACFG